MNHKKLYRLYREEGLSVRRRRGRKRARGSRTPMPVPLRPNDRWSMDFVADTFGASRRLRILAINDDSCRENLCLLGDTSISGVRVARELDTLVRLYGKPACIVSDNVLGHEGKRDLVNRSLCADIERRGMHSEPDGFHRQRDRSLP